MEGGAWLGLFPPSRRHFPLPPLPPPFRFSFPFPPFLSLSAHLVGRDQQLHHDGGQHVTHDIVKHSIRGRHLRAGRICAQRGEGKEEWGERKKEKDMR